MSEWPITNIPISSGSESLCGGGWLAMVLAAAIAVVAAVRAKVEFFLHELSSTYAMTTRAVSTTSEMAIQY